MRGILGHYSFLGDQRLIAGSFMFQFPRGKKFYGKARKWQYVAYMCIHWHNLTVPASLENITSSQVMLVGSTCKDHYCQKWQRNKTERIWLPEWLSEAELPCRPGELTWDRSVRKKEKSLFSLAIKFFLSLFLSLLSPLLVLLFLLPCFIKAHPPKVFWEKKVNVLRHWMSETVFKSVHLIYSLVG